MARLSSAFLRNHGAGTRARGSGCSRSRAVAAESSEDADCVIVQIPSVEQLGAEIEALQKDAAGLPDEQEALLEHLARLRELAVYLNVHLVAPKIPEV